MIGRSNRADQALRVERLIRRLSTAYRRRDAHASYSSQVTPEFSSDVMRSIRVGLVTESPFVRIATRFAILSSACALIMLAINFKALNVVDEARFTGAVGVYGFIL